MRELAPYAGRTLVDLGCGSGYWLPLYAKEAARVIGVEPDPQLLRLARECHGGEELIAGSAEHLPLPDSSVDVVHARFAYFFPPGCEELAECLRVLRCGGQLVVVDNDHGWGDFSQLLTASPLAAPQGRGDVTRAWWKARGARERTVRSEWRFRTRRDFQDVLQMEFPRHRSGLPPGPPRRRRAQLRLRRIRRHEARWARRLISVTLVSIT